MTPSKNVSSKATLKKVLKYLKKYYLLIILSMIFALIIVVFSLYIPILLGKAIDFIVAKDDVDFAKITNLLLQVLIIACVVSILQWIMNNINNKVTFYVVRDVRKDAFKKIEILPLSYIDSHSYGEIVSRVISDVESFADGLLMGFTQLFTGIVTIGGTLVFMYTINPLIATIVVVLTPISLFVARFIASKTYHMFKLQSETRGEQTAIIDEMVNNLKVVEAFNYQDDALEKFKNVNDKLKDCSLKATFFSSITNPCTRFLNSTIYALVCLSGALIAIKYDNALTVGALSCFLNYATQYTKPFNEISGVITELQNALACAARIFLLIEEKPQVEDAPTSVILENVEGKIDIENVYFSYTKEQKLIENLNLSVLKGQHIAIVGPTGCGKTTIINLLMRFYDVDKGKICVDENNILDIKRQSLRSNYGMVLQETWLKEGTIKENIAMGKANASDEEIINAAKQAHAHSFIKQLEKGYDTYISEDGGMLSQGQKQLLCISRVMLSLPPMLILDEATSSIDTRTEIKIQEAFAKLMKNKTSFIVAHRLSTIKSADIILVMKNGNIIEKGSHEQLIALKGFYFELYNSQFVNDEKK